MSAREHAGSGLPSATMAPRSHALDPAAVDVRPVAADHWADLTHVLDTRGDSRRCACQWFRLGTAAWQASDAGTLRAALHRQVLDDPHPPGVIAFVDGEPAGWCAVAPRPGYLRLRRSRKLAAAGVQADLDDETVWAVTCFVVRAEFRGRGLTRALLAGAVAFAADQGARLVEAYPLDGSRRDQVVSAELYVGTLGTFLAAGFTEVGRSAPARPVVRLAVRGRGTAG